MAGRHPETGAAHPRRHRSPRRRHHRTEDAWAESFDLIDHLNGNSSPSCGVAFPHVVKRNQSERYAALVCMVGTPTAVRTAAGASYYNPAAPAARSPGRPPSAPPPRQPAYSAAPAVAARDHPAGVHVVDDVGPPVVISVLELGGVLPDRDVVGVGGGDLLLQGQVRRLDSCGRSPAGRDRRGLWWWGWTE